MVTAHLSLRILSDQQCAIGALPELYSHLRRTRKAYDKYHSQIEKEMSDDDFMALYEQMPEFDDADDDFIVNEEQWTKMIAAYIDDHINNFATIENE